MPRKPLDILEGEYTPGSRRGWGVTIPGGCLTASAGSGAAPQGVQVRGRSAIKTVGGALEISLRARWKKSSAIKEIR